MTAKSTSHFALPIGAYGTVAQPEGAFRKPAFPLAGMLIGKDRQAAMFLPYSAVRRINTMAKRKGIDEVNPAVAAAALGRLGGKASGKKLSKAKRRARAHKAAVARWAKAVAERERSN